MSLALAPTADQFAQLDRKRALVLAFTIGLAAILLGSLIGAQVAGGHVFFIGATVGLLIPVIVWRAPFSGVFVLVLIATVVEQFAMVSDGTDRIGLFTPLSDVAGLSGVHVNPVELLIAFFVLVWALKATLRREFRVQRSTVGAALAVFTAFVALAEVVGLSHGGQFIKSLWELRPWLYLGFCYVLASALVRSGTQLEALLWAFVIGTGFKGLQGLVQYFQIRGQAVRPEAILAHEESFFFGLFILLALGLWLFKIKGALRVVATALLPAVVFADLANGRRTAFLILALGLLVFLVCTWIRLPQRRAVIVGFCATLIVAGAAYLPVFWNSAGTLGQPARTFRSLVAPQGRDQESNQYRVLEDANLGLNIRRSVPFGQGFGVPIDYAIPIVDISNIDSLIKFVPHDGILYIWMRLGFVGAIAFWVLIGTGFIAAGSLVRSMDQRLALYGVLALCALTAYLVQGYNDLGLYWFRIAIFMGIVLGGMEGAIRLAHANSSAPSPVYGGRSGRGPI
jgi:hypothetical protein